MCVCVGGGDSATQEEVKLQRWVLTKAEEAGGQQHTDRQLHGGPRVEEE